MLIYTEIRESAKDEGVKINTDIRRQSATHKQTLELLKVLVVPDCWNNDCTGIHTAQIPRSRKIYLISSQLSFQQILCIYIYYPISI